VPSSTIRPSIWKNSKWLASTPRSGSSGRAAAPGWAADLAHRADLAGRGVRAQDELAARRHARIGDVERVPQVARRVVGGDVQQLEVELVGLDLGALASTSSAVPAVDNRVDASSLRRSSSERRSVIGGPSSSRIANDPAPGTGTGPWDRRQAETPVSW
jgi:hypothetical protein